MADTLLLTAIGAIASLAAALILSKTVSAARVLAFAVVVLAGLFSVAMLIVTLTLSYKVWTDMPARQAPVAVVAASGSAAGASSENGTDAIANAMTAISAVVAVVALILSLGTSWFANEVQRVKAAEQELQRVIAETAQERELARKSRETADALMTAKEALMRWIDECDNSDPALTGQILGHKLEMLACGDRMLRLNAFSNLQVLAPRHLHDPCASLLEPVRRYTQMCHELELQRLAIEAKGRPLDAPPLARPEDGLWCLLFDPIERFRYEVLMRR